ncbi:MAG: UvrB/UvrC motif-containing protein, partial [Shewanella sp.]
QTGYAKGYANDYAKGGGHHHADAAQLSHDIDKLEKQMHEHARNLEFEQAAALRDEVKQLRELLIRA